MSNKILSSISEAEYFSDNLDIPLIDILLISMNLEGVHTNKINSPRVRFKMRPVGDQNYYFALTNDNQSRWIHDGKTINFLGEIIGYLHKVEEDTCDNTYFRRYVNLFGKEIGTELTLNSNSRSNCAGCKFCGTYKLDPEDREEKGLTAPEKLRKKLNKVVMDEGVTDLSHLLGIGIVTGCFRDETETLEHLLMINDVARKDFNFQGEIKYIGSQIRSKDSIKKLSEYASPFGLLLTVECFTRRKAMLKAAKQMSLEDGREILAEAKSKGMSTTILYILGLDPLEVFEKEISLYKEIVTKMPIINTMQEYIKGQRKLRSPDANRIEYYLNSRKILESEYKDTGLIPNIWENYRGIFFTEYNGEKLDGIRI